jgi:hypothetical protein
MHLLVGDTRSMVAGATLGTPAWYRPVLVLPFTPAGARGVPRYLVAVLETPGPFAFVTAERPFEGARAPERFAALAGRRVVGWSRVEGDRVIRLEAGSRETPGTLTLSLHLYGSRGSAVLERGETRLDAVGARRAEGWEPAERRTLVDIDAAALDAAVSLTVVEGAHSPRAMVPGVDRALLDAFTPEGGELDAVALVEFRDALLSGSAPFVLTTGGRLCDAVAVPQGARGVDAGDTAAGPFESALEGCRALGDRVLAGAKEQIIRTLAQPIRRRLASHRKLLAHLESDLDASGGHERMRRDAEILAAYQSTIRPGTAFVELVDVYDQRSTIRLTLDPSLPIQKQIEKRFKKATKLEKSAAHTRRRIDLVGREIAELQAAVELIEMETSLATSLLRLDALRERFAIEPRGGSRKAPSQSARNEAAGRRYDLGEGWYALVGRNNRDNDELTFHLAAPSDLWFHAQSVPGSHVVLKTSRPSGTPPPRVVEMAASLAAHFSRARHSGLVPVIYTQRKYVRKFRGAKPGQVRCEREKMLMVAPAVPESTRD